jgi:HK97 family phage prohead protease
MVANTLDASVRRGRATLHGLLPYDRASNDLGGFVEVIRRGAFSSAFARGSDVCCFDGHDRLRLLGRTSAGSLRLKDSIGGLTYECDLPDTSAGRDVLELVRRGDMRGSSFGFRCVSDSWSRGDGLPTRELRAVKLLDVGPVSEAAYPFATCAIRAARPYEVDADQDLTPVLRSAAQPRSITCRPGSVLDRHLQGREMQKAGDWLRLLELAG